MDDKIKKIIAREGLILLGLLVIGISIYFMGQFFGHSAIPNILTDDEIHKMDMGVNVKHMQFSNFWFSLSIVGFFVGLGGGYVIYLIVRFILWASKTLKQKE